LAKRAKLHTSPPRGAVANGLKIMTKVNCKKFFTPLSTSKEKKLLINRREGERKRERQGRQLKYTFLNLHFT
jgi:hypothetical protein